MEKSVEIKSEIGLITFNPNTVSKQTIEAEPYEYEIPTKMDIVMDVAEPVFMVLIEIVLYILMGACYITGVVLFLSAIK